MKCMSIELIQVITQLEKVSYILKSQPETCPSREKRSENSKSAFKKSGRDIHRFFVAIPANLQTA